MNVLHKDALVLEHITLSSQVEAVVPETDHVENKRASQLNKTKNKNNAHPHKVREKDLKANSLAQE